jgi:polysaccharide biosynthesis/export protein
LKHLWSGIVLTLFSRRNMPRRLFGLAMTLLVVVGLVGLSASQPATAVQLDAAGGQHPLLQLGVGDSITISVYDQPDMTATVYVSDDGTVPVALAGPVRVLGLSPSSAASAIEKALRDGKFFKDPHVTIAVVTSRSQRVSVLGEVNTPGRYPIDSSTGILDLLAQAGGTKESGASTIYLLRPDKDGRVSRYPIDLHALAGSQPTGATQSLQGGDSILVPKVEQFYLYGEVAQPNVYRLDPGMTIEQAIVRAGGITLRGSRSRIEVKRHGPSGDVTSKGKLEDPIHPDDVIRVKESIF